MQYQLSKAQMYLSDKLEFVKHAKYLIYCFDRNNVDERIAQLAGHASETTTYRHYSYDRSPDSEKIKKIENALA